jgi:hypothetical protein
MHCGYYVLIVFRPNIVWDEDNLAYNEANKTATMKIDEPGKRNDNKQCLMSVSNRNALSFYVGL